MEHEIEPIRGLPGNLPPGERILWQGVPDPLLLARNAFHVRGVAIYFALLMTVALSMAVAHRSSFTGTLITAGLGLVAVTLLHVLAWLSARASVYTLTDRRLVLRIGVALPTCVNLPLTRVAAVNLSAAGDVALQLTDAPPLGWIALWPHARPWRLSRPDPMLRALPHSGDVAARVARACLAAAPNGQITPAPAASSAPVPARVLPETVMA